VSHLLTRHMCMHAMTWSALLDTIHARSQAGSRTPYFMASVFLCASRACHELISAKWNSLQTFEFVVIFPVELCCCASGVVGSFHELARCLHGMVSGTIFLL
jgi:hypothetical protein